MFDDFSGIQYKPWLDPLTADQDEESLIKSVLSLLKENSISLRQARYLFSRIIQRIEETPMK